MKATLHKKIRRLKAEKKTSVASEGVDEAATMGWACDDEDNEQELYFDDGVSMDYSSLEECSQSAAEMNEERKTQSGKGGNILYANNL